MRWIALQGLCLVTLLWLVAPEAFAHASRYRLTKPVEAGDRVARRRMTRLIAVELVLALLILAATSAWRFTPPPRANVVASSMRVHVHGGGASANVTFTEQTDGRWSAAIALQEDSRPAREVTLRVGSTGKGIEPAQRGAARRAEGTWVADGIALPSAGRWQVRVDALVSDFETVGMEGELDLVR